MRLPSGSFLDEFIRSAQGSETPAIYDLWTGIWTLGTAVGRTVYVDRPTAPVFLNWYVILVSESGVTRKSTAVRRARKLINNIGVDEIIESRETAESLEARLFQYSHMSGRARIAVVVDEMVRILGKEAYTMNMPGLLTDLYDCPETRTSGLVTSGQQKIKFPYVTLLTASTPTWLARAINPQVIDGGFASRAIFVSSNRRKRVIAWPSDARRTHSVDLETLLQETAHTAQRAGPVATTRNSLATFKSWYGGRRYSTHPYLSSFEAREDDHVLRVAAILAVNARTNQITQQQLTQAMKLIAEVKQCGAELFAGADMHGHLTRAINRFIKLLQEAGERGVVRTQVYRRMNQLVTAEELESLVEIMHELEMIERFSMPARGRGRPAEVLRGTNYLNDVARNHTLIARVH